MQRKRNDIEKTRGWVRGAKGHGIKARRNVGGGREALCRSTSVRSYAERLMRKKGMILRRLGEGFGWGRARGLGSTERWQMTGIAGRADRSGEKPIREGAGREGAGLLSGQRPAG